MAQRDLRNLHWGKNHKKQASIIKKGSVLVVFRTLPLALRTNLFLDFKESIAVEIVHEHYSKHGSQIGETPLPV